MCLPSIWKLQVSPLSLTFIPLNARFSTACHGSGKSQVGADIEKNPSASRILCANHMYSNYT
eukprot:m.275413 g.275413  ORF g.275413 m.275413 type:complete len:62 (+) comp16137_c0_seq7:2024-2209(+)